MPVAAVEGKVGQDETMPLGRRRRYATFTPPLTLVAVVVVDRVPGPEDLAQPRLAGLARTEHHLLRVRVLADLDTDQRRQRQIAYGQRAGVDDLMGHLKAAGRARDHVVLADRVALIALALQNDKHFLGVEHDVGACAEMPRQTGATASPSRRPDRSERQDKLS